MKFSKIVLMAIGCSSSVIPMSANAANFVFSGNLLHHNHVIETHFSLFNDSTNVAVWTDSFMSGVNFNPVTALWQLQGSSYVLLDENDDNPFVSPLTQTYHDSGFTLGNLAAGEYVFTMGAFANFANGTLLSEGFAYDFESPIALEDWCQPANKCNVGSFWRVNLSGVDDALTIPEPATWALMIMGIAGVGAAMRRRHIRQTVNFGF